MDKLIKDRSLNIGVTTVALCFCALNFLSLNEAADFIGQVASLAVQCSSRSMSGIASGKMFALLLGFEATFNHDIVLSYLQYKYVLRYAMDNNEKESK